MPSNVTAAVAPPSLKRAADSSSSASAMQARPGSFTHCTCATSPGSSATAVAKVVHWSPAAAYSYFAAGSLLLVGQFSTYERLRRAHVQLFGNCRTH